MGRLSLEATDRGLGVVVVVIVVVVVVVVVEVVDDPVSCCSLSCCLAMKEEGKREKRSYSWSLERCWFFCWENLLIFDAASSAAGGVFMPENPAWMARGLGMGSWSKGWCKGRNGEGAPAPPTAGALQPPTAPPGETWDNMDILNPYWKFVGDI